MRSGKVETPTAGCQGLWPCLWDQCPAANVYESVRRWHRPVGPRALWPVRLRFSGPCGCSRCVLNPGTSSSVSGGCRRLIPEEGAATVWKPGLSLCRYPDLYRLAAPARNLSLAPARSAGQTMGGGWGAREPSRRLHGAGTAAPRSCREGRGLGGAAVPRAFWLGRALRLRPRPALVPR